MFAYEIIQLSNNFKIMDMQLTVSLLVYIYLCNVTCPAANISGASLRNTPPSGSNLSRSLNQIRELSSYKTTNSSLHALPNKRSNGKKEIHYVI